MLSIGRGDGGGCRGVVRPAHQRLRLGGEPLVGQPSPEWGAMLATGREYMRVAPHLVLFPGLAIVWVVLGFNLLGDALRDLLDPRGRTRTS